MSACAGTTKAGNPCKANPLKGTDRCLAHSDEATRTSTNFQQGPRPGRPRVPKPTELARRLVEENIAIVQRPYWRALGYDVEIGDDGPEVVKVEGGGAKIYGVSAKDGVVYVSEHDDLGAMITASEKLQDRAFGRSKQMTEITGADGGPVETVTIVPLDAEQRSARAAELLKRHGHA